MAVTGYPILRFLADEGLSVQANKEAGLVLVPMRRAPANVDAMVVWARRQRDRIYAEVQEFVESKPPVEAMQ